MFDVLFSSGISVAFAKSVSTAKPIVKISKLFTFALSRFACKTVYHTCSLVVEEPVPTRLPLVWLERLVW